MITCQISVLRHFQIDVLECCVCGMVELVEFGRFELIVRDNLIKLNTNTFENIKKLFSQSLTQTYLVIIQMTIIPTTIAKTIMTINMILSFSDVSFPLVIKDPRTASLSMSFEIWSSLSELVLDFLNFFRY